MESGHSPLKNCLWLVILIRGNGQGTYPKQSGDGFERRPTSPGFTQDQSSQEGVGPRKYHHVFL